VDHALPAVLGRYLHAGSAGGVGAIVMIQPDRDLALVVLPNAGSDDAILAAQAAAIELPAR
jgi:hypothetical protein